MHENLRVYRIILLHGAQHTRFAAYTTEEIAAVSRETRVEPHVIDFADPWEGASRVDTSPLGFCRA
jgi:transcriptional regulatory protein RtcR